MLCIVFIFSSLHYTALHFDAEWCSMLQTVVRCSSLHCSYLFNYELHCTPFGCRVMQSAAGSCFQHCTAQHLYAEWCSLLLTAVVISSRLQQSALNCCAHIMHTLQICNALQVSGGFKCDAICCRLMLSTLHSIWMLTAVIFSRL